MATEPSPPPTRPVVALRHAPCGAPLQARWFCPTRESIVEDAGAPETRIL